MFNFTVFGTSIFFFFHSFAQDFSFIFLMTFLSKLVIFKLTNYIFSGMFPILLPQLLAVATFRRYDVASHTFDAEFEDESSDRIESELWNEQLSPYVEHNDDLKSDV